MLLPLLLYFPPLLILSLLLHNYLLLPSHIPGPLLARLTNLHRLLSVLLPPFRPHESQFILHKRHGDIIRLGPQVLSLRGPQFVQQIYGITGPAKNVRKSDFYACFQNVVNGKRAASLVAMTDEGQHARTKRAIANAYSLSKLVEFEVLVDSTVRVFLDTMAERFIGEERNGNGKGDGAVEGGKVCDLGRWLQYFAFDVIGELTFSKRLGFLETGEDVNGIIKAIGANFRYFSVLGQMPWLDGWLGKNPVYVRFFRKSVSSPILLFAQKLLQERLEGLEDGTGEKGAAEKEVVDKPDFLSKFLAARKDTEEPQLMADRHLLSYLFMNINAGSDTIASTLKGIFYGLLMNPESMKKLVGELEAAQEKGTLTSPTPTWQESQQLEYLGAVVKEGLRLNPALSLSLERIVPAEGMRLQTGTEDDQNEPLVVPRGTVVGINPWIQHRDERIFGEKPEDWWPERWLTEEERETKSMEHNLLSFGAGKRSCLGKNVAMLELHKVVPAMMMRFDIRWAKGYEDGRGWNVVNKWVLEQNGLMVELREREAS